ncbi:hypothetical protein FRC01_008902 [Tulasnella sp. 417]|nr:hypothetical protein FRC01_008902 [Tulasnella sp. 417]
MFWPSGAFLGLKSLHLGHVCGASLTTRYILEVLSANPELETLTLKKNAIQYNPSDMELPQVVLPCLRNLDYMPDHGFAIDQTLRHITLLPNSIKNLSITDSEDVSEQANNRYEDFLTTVLISLAPTLGRLHERCGGSYLHFYPATQQNKAQFSWDSQLEDLRLRIYIPEISPSIALQWVGGVLCLAKPGITMTVHEESLSGDVVRSMQSMQCVEQLLVYNFPISALARAQQLLDALGGSSAASPDSPISAPFPSLHTSKLAGWEMGLDPIINMVHKRFSEASGLDPANRVPDLSLDISLWDWVWTRCYGPDSIWTLAVVQGIRAMPGVKGVRLGQVSDAFGAGILAVVWDEELMAPVWG